MSNHQVVFVRFTGGPLDAQHLFYERREGEPWPPPLHAWWVKSGEGFKLYQPLSDGTRPPALRGLKVERYRRVQSTVPDTDDEPSGNQVHGAFYRHDPE